MSTYKDMGSFSSLLKANNPIYSAIHRCTINCMHAAHDPITTDLQHIYSLNIADLTENK